MIVYIDVIFIENIIINFFLIYITSKLIKIKQKVVIFLVASLIATLYTIISIIYPIDLFRNFIFKLMLALIICKISYKPANIIDLIKYTITFYFVTFIFGGIVFSELTKVKNISSILFIMILGSPVLLLLWKMFKTKLNKESSICNIELKINNEIIKTTALIDTGHELRNNLLNEDVVIIDDRLIENIKIINILKGQIFEIPKDYETKVRIINYKVLGNENNIAIGLKLDYIHIYYDNQIIENKNVIMITKDNGFSKYGAIINFDLIEGGRIYGNSNAYKIKDKKIIC